MKHSSNFLYSFFIISSQRGILKTFWCNTRCFFNYIYIMIVEHFNKDTFVFNKVICFNRDQFAFIFIFGFDILIFFSFDLYVFIWYCSFICNKKYDCIPECLARWKVLFSATYSKYLFLVFLVSVLHFFFTFL